MTRFYPATLNGNQALNIAYDFIHRLRDEYHPSIHDTMLVSLPFLKHSIESGNSCQMTTRMIRFIGIMVKIRDSDWPSHDTYFDASTSRLSFSWSGEAIVFNKSTAGMCTQLPILHPVSGTLKATAAPFEPTDVATVASPNLSKDIALVEYRTPVNLNNQSMAEEVESGTDLESSGVTSTISTPPSEVTPEISVATTPEQGTTAQDLTDAEMMDVMDAIQEEHTLFLRAGLLEWLV